MGTNEIILLPSLQKKLMAKKYRSHLETVRTMKTKLEKMGINALKILAVEGPYLLGELKVHRPPYRLYVIADQKNNRFFLADWEHKSKQENAIITIKGKLASAGEYTLGELFT